MSVSSFASVLAGSYLLCSTSQSGYPKNYLHEDGGVYNGQWQGKNKQGLGSYLYPGGAKYEGEWRNNSKEGRGVYTFPKVSTCADDQLRICRQHENKHVLDATMDNPQPSP